MTVCRFQLLLGAALLTALPAWPETRPNILWITSEDNGPQLGCFGDAFARTPHLDSLAARGVCYRKVWSTAPVCAPARTALITGLYPSATGSEHMRSMARLPAGMKLFPQFLREAGYYCSNNDKEDYNVEKPGTVWDDSSRRAHWRNRKPDQPFFAVFNLFQTHESQIRARPHVVEHDPARVRVPAYHPDTPEVRQDWAQYYDQMRTMDAQAGRLLRELDEAGLSGQTIVFYFGDNGIGLPRAKRCCYDSGLHVPLIVSIPEAWRHLAPPGYQTGGASDRLVGFVDFAPTMLRLAGIPLPDYLQGLPFLGPSVPEAAAYLHGLRGRMDERIDLVRSVSDGRYVYLRNYMPHKPYGQFIAYMFETPTTRVWQQAFAAGRLAPEQAAFWQPHPPEELYDLQADPDEVHNLAASPPHAAALARLRQAQRDHALAVRDVGLMPEPDLVEQTRDRSPYELGRNEARLPLRRVLDLAELASSRAPDALPRLRKSLQDADATLRYWAVLGLRLRGVAGVEPARSELRLRLNDASPSVRVAAAEALGLYGEPEDLQDAMTVLLAEANVATQGFHRANAALNAIDELGPRARPYRDAIAALPAKSKAVHPRMADDVARLQTRILSQLATP